MVVHRHPCAEHWSLHFCLSILQCLQLPWWGVMLACAIAFFFTLPIGIIAATTNQVSRATPIQTTKSLWFQEFLSEKLTHVKSNVFLVCRHLV